MDETTLFITIALLAGFIGGALARQPHLWELGAEIDRLLRERREFLETIWLLQGEIAAYRAWIRERMRAVEAVEWPEEIEVEQ